MVGRLVLIDDWWAQSGIGDGRLWSGWVIVLHPRLVDQQQYQGQGEDQYQAEVIHGEDLRVLWRNGIDAAGMPRVTT